MTYDIETRVLREQPAAVIRAVVAVEELPAFLTGVFEEVFSHLNRWGIAPAGAPFARFSVRNGKVEVEAGAPVDRRVEAAGRVEPSVLPGGWAAVTVHAGPYDTIEPAYAALAAWIEDGGCLPAGQPWECYMSDPSTPPEEIRTQVVAPYRQR